MGSTTIYLLPDLRGRDPAEYASQAVSVLSAWGVIDPEPDPDDPGFYGPGDASVVPFEEAEGWDSGFEVCIVYGSSRACVVPTDPAVSPRCPRCSHDVSETYYDTVNDAWESEPETPPDTLRVRCGGCGAEHRLDHLVDDVGIFLVTAYLNFDDVPGGIRPEWLAALDERLGVNHRCVQYWYT
jgi:hypothetical protein